MKYKRIMFISLLLSLIGLMCLFVFAEKEVLPILTWERTFGGSGDDVANSLIQTTDGGYMVAGPTYSKGAGEQDFWVIKLDSKGNMIWDRTYGGSACDEARSLIQTTDGGYAVAGYSSSKGAGGCDFWVIKLDHQGNMVWDKTFGGRNNDGAGFLSLIQTTDGGYAVAGDTFSKGAGNVDFWVIKLDHQGNMVWDKTFGGRSFDWVRSLIQTTDGGYAVAGYTYSKGAGGADFWVIKLDHQGNMIWDRTYGGSDNDWAYSLFQTTDGGYAVAGYTDSKGAGEKDFWVIKLDAQDKSLEKIDTQNIGAINLTSTPSSAKVFLEAGQYIGKTPLVIDKVSPGKHNVTLVLDDYEKYVQEVDVIAGKVFNVSATLVATRIQPTSRIWSLEGRFINFSSLCEFRDHELKLLSPQSVTYYKGTERKITGCLTLDEKLLPQQPLAIIIKIHNSTDVGQALTLPLLSDLIVHTQTDSKPALAFYYPWGSVDLRGWVTELKGEMGAQVKTGTAMELLYLIPGFNGKAKIELLNIGSFEINEPK
ncbi:hypothetical protein ES705_30145 [subsurface metagenome]